MSERTFCKEEGGGVSIQETKAQNEREKEN
jgi:hypothetical protein